MLKNNGKMIVGRNFLFCLCVICLMFTAFGFAVEDSFAADLNETADEMGLESDNMAELENSQDNNVLEVDSQDYENELGAVHTPSGNNYANIQEKVNAASPGDTILLKGTYHSNGNDRILINKRLTIAGDGIATLDGMHLSTAFFVNENGAGTVFKNLKFINGEGELGSAIIIDSKNVHIEKCIFEDNHADSGGAIKTKYDQDRSSGLIVDNCEFRRNTGYSKDFNQPTSAGALSVYGKDSEIRNCLFEDNWIKSNFEAYGGAIQVGLDEIGSNVKISNCIFRNNGVISTNKNSHGVQAVSEKAQFIQTAFS